ncbi:MAG: hypothetical protein HUJ68_09780 [Clostridia bacterium]|nr:hypothetical protein [Clostridia bacterium]
MQKEKNKEKISGYDKLRELYPNSTNIIGLFEECGLDKDKLIIALMNSVLMLYEKVNAITDNLSKNIDVTDDNFRKIFDVLSDLGYEVIEK